MTKSEKRWATVTYNNFVLRLRQRELSWNRGSASAWTRSLMRLLGNMGREYGLKPYSKCHRRRLGKSTCGEYMVDMCWAMETNKVEYIDTVIEEEWNDRDKDNFLKDFYKLTDFKAYLRYLFMPRRPESHLNG